MKSIFKYTYFASTAIRISAIVLFLQNPLFAWLITFMLDTVDYTFALRGGFTYRLYQNIDKSVDFLSRVYFVITAYHFSWPHAWLFVALFVLRLMGDALYFKTRNESYFFMFPNTIEFVFPLYILCLPSPTTEQLVAIIVVAFAAKLVQEYVGHIRKWIDPVSLAYVQKHPEHRRETKTTP